jgi:hypothetical protein
MPALSIQSSIAVLVATLIGLAALPALAGPLVTLVPHRAIYDLSLLSRESSSSVMTVRGRMVHEFNGASCEGYSVSMRWVAEMGGPAGDVDVEDIRFASFEEGDSASYNFTSVRRRNDAVVGEVKAHALGAAAGKAGRVRLSAPADGEVALPAGTIFPTAHLRSIIRMAMADEHIVEQDVYDVSEDGRQIYHTLAVVGAAQETSSARATQAEPARKALAGLREWRVTVSYFEGTGVGDETPAFSQSFDLFENGVESGLVLDYGDFVIRGRLTDLEYLDSPDCAGAPGPGAD